MLKPIKKRETFPTLIKLLIRMRRTTPSQGGDNRTSPSQGGTNRSIPSHQGGRSRTSPSQGELRVYP